MRKSTVVLSSIVGGLSLLAASNSRAAGFTLIDSFTRADSDAVGNGWGEVERNDPDFDGVGTDIRLNGATGTQRFNTPSDPTSDLDDEERSAKNVAVGSRILNNTTGTLFFKLRLSDTDARNFDLAFGMTNKNNANQRAKTLVDIHATGTSTATIAGSAFVLSPDVDYFTFIVVNNTAHTYSLYVSTDGDASDETAVLSNVAMKAIPAGDGNFTGVDAHDLVAPVFYSADPALGGADVFDIDDVSIDTGGSNLISPVAAPEPASLGLISLGALAVLRRRCRRSI